MMSVLSLSVLSGSDVKNRLAAEYPRKQQNEWLQIFRVEFAQKFSNLFWCIFTKEHHEKSSSIYGSTVSDIVTIRLVWTVLIL